MAALSEAGKTLVVGATGKVRAAHASHTLQTAQRHSASFRVRNMMPDVQVGMAVVRLLSRKGVSVVALARDPQSPKAKKLAALPRVQVVKGDVT